LASSANPDPGNRPRPLYRPDHDQTGVDCLEGKDGKNDARGSPSRDRIFRWCSRIRSRRLSGRKGGTTWSPRVRCAGTQQAKGHRDAKECLRLLARSSPLTDFQNEFYGWPAPQRIGLDRALALRPGGRVEDEAVRHSNCHVAGQVLKLLAGLRPRLVFHRLHHARSQGGRADLRPRCGDERR